MYKSPKVLEKQFIDRAHKLEATTLLINDGIALLYASDSNLHLRNLKDFIIKIDGYKANQDDTEAVKQILQEVLNNEIDHQVALAHLNYLYDIACFKRSHLVFMKETFGCFF